VTATLSALLERIARRDYTVAIVGLGYVGLPLAIAFARQGFSVLGVDVDASKIAQLVEGRSYLSHIDIAPLIEAKAAARFDATVDFDRLRNVDAVLLCVPTPVDAHQQPDLRFVRTTTEAVLQRLQPHQLVVLESTTYPGTTDELVREILEQRGARAGQDFFLAYSPEREDPGNARFATSSIPKLVGGVDADSGVLAAALYRAAISEVVVVGSARVAEAAKLTENIFRAVNIALVNELKVTFDRMGLDIWEVLDAASTKPFGFMRFNPGPGWGGHCIPVGASPKFIELAGEINIRMHEYVVNKLVHGLSRQGKAVNGARVLLLGIAYKKNVDDCRESPAFPIMDQLERLGAKVTFHDDHIEEVPALREWPQFVDVALLVTDHDRVDYESVLQHAPLIVDSRGVYRSPSERVVRA
jgi:UDP-N-acetyl-D-glucosamine dehydrogenase